MNAIESRVLSFLQGVVDPDLELDSKLIDSGVLDSFHLVELLAFVEKDFDVRILPSDLTQKDLESPQTIADFVIRLVSVAREKSPDNDPSL